MMLSVFVPVKLAAKQSNPKFPLGWIPQRRFLAPLFFACGYFMATLRNAP
jgi:hypothetical protein